jgi:translation initiation factor 3 subunit F
MLDRVLSYVRSVLAGEVKGDAAVGRYLMDTFGASTDELEKGAFNASLQASHPHFFFALTYYLQLIFDRIHLWSRISQTWSAHKRKFLLA